MIETTSATEKYRSKCEDRVEVVQLDDRTVIVVADGAGGSVQATWQPNRSCERFDRTLQKFILQMNGLSCLGSLTTRLTKVKRLQLSSTCVLMELLGPVSVTAEHGSSTTATSLT